MKLDRNINKDGHGKYAVINLRKMSEMFKKLNPKNPDDVAVAINTAPELLEYNDFGTAQDFFVIKLKDVYAKAALLAYATAIMNDNSEEGGDFEYAKEIFELARFAGPHSPYCKVPD